MSSSRSAILLILLLSTTTWCWSLRQRKDFYLAESLKLYIIGSISDIYNFDKKLNRLFGKLSFTAFGWDYFYLCKKPGDFVVRLWFKYFFCQSVLPPATSWSKKMD